MKNKKAMVPYFYIEQAEEEKTADVYIFGDIASEKGGLAGLLSARSDVSSYGLAQEINRIPPDYGVTVHINSNGGELKEGLGIYNVLKDRGNVTTICEGFAASAGSVIFAAGNRRIMQPASLLFIHQASMGASGNADDFEKLSADLRVITDAAVAAYMESGVNISKDELMVMLKEETWIAPQDAVEKGFATEIAEPDPEEDGTVRNDAMQSIMAAVTTREEAPGGKPAEKSMKEDYAHAFELLGKIENVLESNPAIMEKAEEYIAALENITIPAPAPRVHGENKGFFGFAQAGEPAKEV